MSWASHKLFAVLQGAAPQVFWVRGGAGSCGAVCARPQGALCGAVAVSAGSRWGGRCRPRRWALSARIAAARRLPLPSGPLECVVRAWEARSRRIIECVGPEPRKRVFSPEDPMRRLASSLANFRVPLFHAQSRVGDVEEAVLQAALGRARAQPGVESVHMPLTEAGGASRMSTERRSAPRRPLVPPPVGGAHPPAPARRGASASKVVVCMRGSALLWMLESACLRAGILGMRVSVRLLRGVGSRQRPAPPVARPPARI